MNLEVKSSPNARTEGAIYEHQACNYRYFGEFSCSNWLIYSSIGVKVGHEYLAKYWWGNTWKTTPCPYISFTYTGFFGQGPLVFPKSGGSSGSGKDCVVEFVTESVGISTFWINGTGQAQVVGNDNQTRYLTFYY
jgi:hypothetical protein